MPGPASGLVRQGGETLRGQGHPLGLQKPPQVGHVLFRVGDLRAELHAEGKKLQEFLVLLQEGDHLRGAHQEDLVVRRVEGVFPGVYHYFPKEHQLFQIAARVEEASWSEALLGLGLEQAAALLVLALVPERSEALFGLRGYRYALLEAGYAAGLVLLSAIGQGLAAYPAETFYDEMVAHLLRLPEGEYPGVVVILGR
ncbi:nitroreductase family protein [Thermus scotoductus]|uniref:nitroreductase family protein n=1 Tax=Thermus scotoductus TaxID=37636 RepID=UPI003F514315